MNVNRIREFMSYDPETGVFRWIANQKGRGYPFKVGDVVGCVRFDGRRIIGFAYKEYLASRLAWFFVHGELLPPEVKIDHRNRNCGDDRIENLRVCGQSENCLNQSGWRQRKNKNSGFKGVHWSPQRKKWTASFRNKYLGIFVDPADAARVYDGAAGAHDPEFALLNFPKENDSCLAS